MHIHLVVCHHLLSSIQVQPACSIRCLVMAAAQSSVTLCSVHSSLCWACRGAQLSASCCWVRAAPSKGSTEDTQWMPHISSWLPPAARAGLTQAPHRGQDYSLPEANVPRKLFPPQLFLKANDFVVINVMMASIHIFSLHDSYNMLALLHSLPFLPAVF